VVKPGHADVEIAAFLALHADAPPPGRARCGRRPLTGFLDPPSGGDGWQFGRHVHTSGIEAPTARPATTQTLLRISGPSRS
jgi:hypothetical protein